MTTIRYRKRPVEVDTIQWTGDNEVELVEFTGHRFEAIPSAARAENPDVTAQVYDELHDTWVGVKTGQHIVRGVKGEFYPIAEDVLAETYERVGTGPGASEAAEPDSRDDGHPVPPSDEELNSALPVRPNPRQPAYDVVYEYIRGLGEYLPPDPVHRNAVIWRAVHAALDATHVGRCVSSHCVEGDHMVFVDEHPGSGATEAEATTSVFAVLHRSAEQDVTRVIGLYERWVKAGPPPLGTSVSRWWDARLAELHDAILLPADASKDPS